MRDFTLTIDKKKAAKMLGYLLCLTAFYILSSARGVLSDVNYATVNALPFLVAAIAFYDGPYMGGVMGVYGGLLLSILACGSLFITLRGIFSATYYVLFYSIPFRSIFAGYLRILAISSVPGAVGYFLIKAIHRRCSEGEY